MSNSREIVIHKNNKQAAPFVSLSMATIVDAYKRINDAEAFYLYIYLCGNTNHFSMPFSAEKLSAKCGQPASLIEENFNKLVSAGILVKRSENSDIYDFYASNEPTHIYSNPLPKNMFYWGE